MGAPSDSAAKLTAPCFGFVDGGDAPRAIRRDGSRSDGSVLSLGRREPGPYLCAQPLHGSGEVLTSFTSIKELVGDAERRQDGAFLGLDDVAGAHRLADHVVNVLGHGSSPLGAGVASDRVLVAEDGDADDILLGRQRAPAPSCCCRRKRTRSIIRCVRARAASSRLVSPAFSFSRNCTRSGDTTPFTPVDSRFLMRASACSARRRNEASSSPRCFTSCSSSANAAISGRTLSDTQFSL